MNELNPKEILDVISEIKAGSIKLCKLLPDDVILNIPQKGASSLLDIRGMIVDIGAAFRKANGAILHLQEALDEQESETKKLAEYSVGFMGDKA